MPYVVENALELFCNSLILSWTPRPSFNCGNILVNDPLFKITKNYKTEGRKSIFDSNLTV